MHAVPSLAGDFSAELGGLLSGPASHSVLRPAGVQAASIHSLWQLTLWVCMSVFTAILLVLILALARRRRSRGPDYADEGTGSHQASRRWVTVASIVSALLLFALLVADVATGRALSRLPTSDALRIEMTAQQWWWQARYLDAAGNPEFTVAGDLHLPLGRPVVIALKSADVIHTFWVPSLHGKKDMLPGRSTELVLRADRPGTYRGACAEFCGLQHALMAFSVTVQPQGGYEAWRAAQAAPARMPDTVEGQRGRALFESLNCAGCHAVRGTPAAGTLGPDLTHVGSRPVLAAGTVPRTREHLAAWIVDPQSLKPGSTMPASRLDPQQVAELVAYLEGLR
uniref:cytochrome c oxidase subunit II n=1 Tax=Variovorax sp. BK018 TaxID=3450241 RepID=UPI004039159A